MKKISVFFVTYLLALMQYQASAKSKEQWWKYGHFAHIYPRSYQDSNGDGIGDLNGIASRLWHLKEIGVIGMWLSPIFKSPQVDFGYDVSDYYEIDPIFGTMEDFENLIARCHEIGLKLILDFVLNHTSDKHKWFIASMHPEDPDHATYKDFYIWSDGIVAKNGTRIPPSNWLASFGGSAWTWVEERKQYYLHQFAAGQPELNYRNEEVPKEMKNILRFYLRKGVDGFREDAVPYLFEAPIYSDGSYPDEPPAGPGFLHGFPTCPGQPTFYCYLNHTETFDRPETIDLTYEWRSVVDEEEFQDEVRVLLPEPYSTVPNLMKYYGRQNREGVIVQPGAQIPFNFLLINTNSTSTAYEFRDIIEQYLCALPKGKDIQPNWVLGNHDRVRVATRYGPDKTDLINIFLKTMPGITITYYGEEIGMTDRPLSFSDTVDPRGSGTNPQIYQDYSRDPSRTPMQWDDSFQAGFSTAQKTWLPISSNYTIVNVSTEKAKNVSYYSNFLRLIKLRKNRTMKYGGFQMFAPNQNILVYKRQMKKGSKYAKESNDIFVIVLNFGYSNETVNLKSLFKRLQPEQMKVVVASIQSTSPVIGDVVNSTEIVLEPAVGLVLMGVC